MSMLPVAPARPDQLRRVWPVRPGVSALVVAGFVALLWVVQAVNAADGGVLTLEGEIMPRQESGLDGIVFAPVLHAGWMHLESNTLPVVIFAFLATSAGLARFGVATAVIWATAGVGTWLFAQPGSVHVGASSLVFGWMVLLLVRGFFARSAGQIILSLILFLLYGSLLWGSCRATRRCPGRATCSAPSVGCWPRCWSAGRVDGPRGRNSSIHRAGRAPAPGWRPAPAPHRERTTRDSSQTGSGAS